LRQAAKVAGTTRKLRTARTTKLLEPIKETVMAEERKERGVVLGEIEIEEMEEVIAPGILLGD
jgi:hypothetical protein